MDVKKCCCVWMRVLCSVVALSTALNPSIGAVAQVSDPVVDVWTLQSDSMPADIRLVPAVGNGHVATQVFGDTIYVNNVFNGYTMDSHRARIPSTAAISVSLNGASTSTYKLHMRAGLFTRQIDHQTCTIEQRIYAHRVRTRLLVNEFTVTRKPSAGNDAIVLQLTNNMGAPSMDMSVNAVNYTDETMLSTGQIYQPETNTSERVTIYQYWTKVPATVELGAGQHQLTMRYLTSISIDQADAETAFNNAVDVPPATLLMEHVQAWEAIWQEGSFEIAGNASLAQTLNAAMFHIMISSPDQSDTINPFGGLSPGGLARGGKVNMNFTGGAYNDYAGHLFWDMDTWIMPAILMFHPNMARVMISARTRVMGAARANAQEWGLEGVRFPWEQAYTGFETCPWDLASLYQLHVTADVSYSVRQYLYTTGDLDFIYFELGKELVMDIARFWKSRSTKIDDSKYGIDGVMGPDEYHSNINNSVFTNYNAKLSLEMPQYLADLGVSFDTAELAEIAVFNDIASKMYILFNADLKFHPQFEGFDHENATIKQSDVVLLGYPLMMDMDTEVRRNDLVLYENLTDKYGPDTGTWSMHTVGWLELHDKPKADEMFQYMLRNINGPFKIFSEKPADGTEGMRATNFITLAGGMLQAVIFGYGGVRVRQKQLDISPYVLPDTDSWQLRGFKYMNSTLDFTFYEDRTLVSLRASTLEREPLVAMSHADLQRHTLETGVTLKLPQGAATIVTQSNEQVLPTAAPTTTVPPVSAAGVPLLSTTTLLLAMLLP